MPPDLTGRAFPADAPLRKFLHLSAAKPVSTQVCPILAITYGRTTGKVRAFRLLEAAWYNSIYESD